MSKEKFIKQVKKLESIVKKNSNCRHERDILNCTNCDIYRDCLSNNYDHELSKKRDLSNNLPDSWKIEKAIRAGEM